MIRNMVVAQIFELYLMQLEFLLVEIMHRNGSINFILINL